MRRIINGKVYDSDTAKFVADICCAYQYGDFRWYDETLYVKRTGEFFLVGEGGPLSKYSRAVNGGWGDGMELIPLTDDEVKSWLEEHASYAYEEYFPIEDDCADDFEHMSLFVPNELYKELLTHSEESSIELKDYVMSLLNNAVTSN